MKSINLFTLLVCLLAFGLQIGLSRQLTPDDGEDDDDKQNQRLSVLKATELIWFPDGAEPVSFKETKRAIEVLGDFYDRSIGLANSELKSMLDEKAQLDAKIKSHKQLLDATMKLRADLDELVAVYMLDHSSNQTPGFEDNQGPEVSSAV